MSGNKHNRKRFLKRIAKAIQAETGTVDAGKEYAAIYNTKSPEVSQVNASRLLNSDYGKKTLAEYLAVDYPKAKRSKRLAELANAEKDHVLQDGVIVPIRDNQASLRALELMAKLDGETDNTSVDARSVHFHVTAEDAVKIADLADKLERLRIGKATS